MSEQLTENQDNLIKTLNDVAHKTTEKVIADENRIKILAKRIQINKDLMNKLQQMFS